MRAVMASLAPFRVSHVSFLCVMRHGVTNDSLSGRARSGESHPVEVCTERPPWRSRNHDSGSSGDPGSDASSVTIRGTPRRPFPNGF